MPTPDVALRHEVLKAEQIGDTLVVTPMGDLVGFSQTQFKTELSIVRQLAAEPSVSNIVVNLSREEYFGAEMMSILQSLKEELSGTGQLIFADASPQMKLVLQKLNLIDSTITFRSSASAIHDVSASQLSGGLYVTKTTYREWRPRLIVLGIAVVVGFLGWWAVSQITTPQIHSDVAELKEIWVDAEDYRRHDLKQLPKFLERSQERIVEIQKRYREKSKRSPLETRILQAANALQQNLITKTGTPESAEQFQFAIGKVENMID